MYFSRGKNKVQDLAGMKDLYDFYHDRYKDNNVYDTDYQTYHKLIDEYYKVIMGEILNGYCFKLPYMLGNISIIKRLVNVNNLTRFGINWVESVKNSKVVYHLNPHSKNYIYRFVWDKKKSKIPNLYYYKFIASRTNKRELAKIIKSKKLDYFEK